MVGRAPLCKPEVAGSIPAGSTRVTSAIAGVFAFSGPGRAKGGCVSKCVSPYCASLSHRCSGCPGGRGAPSPHRPGPRNPRSRISAAYCYRRRGARFPRSPIYGRRCHSSFQRPFPQFGTLLERGETSQEPPVAKASPVQGARSPSAHARTRRGDAWMGKRRRTDPSPRPLTPETRSVRWTRVYQAPPYSNGHPHVRRWASSRGAGYVL